MSLKMFLLLSAVRLRHTRGFRCGLCVQQCVPVVTFSQCRDSLATSVPSPEYGSASTPNVSFLLCLSPTNFQVFGPFEFKAF